MNSGPVPGQTIPLPPQPGLPAIPYRGRRHGNSSGNGGSQREDDEGENEAIGGTLVVHPHEGKEKEGWQQDGPPDTHQEG